MVFLWKCNVLNSIPTSWDSSANWLALSVSSCFGDDVSISSSANFDYGYATIPMDLFVFFNLFSWPFWYFEIRYWCPFMKISSSLCWFTARTWKCLAVWYCSWTKPTSICLLVEWRWYRGFSQSLERSSDVLIWAFTAKTYCTAGFLDYKLLGFV
jgi:hypothetical protein